MSYFLWGNKYITGKGHIFDVIQDDDRMHVICTIDFNEYKILNNSCYIATLSYMEKPQFPNNLKSMSYFTCSPKHTFLFFTGLNI